MENSDYYTKYFGKPTLVANSVIPAPRVDILLFRDEESDEYLYITRGMDTAGFGELIMITMKKQEWPPYFMRAICRYEINSKTPIAVNETYDHVDPISRCNDFNKALFLDTEEIGLKQKELMKKLKLKSPPLYVLPITRKELKFAMDNSTFKLLERLAEKIEPVGNISRKSVV